MRSSVTQHSNATPSLIQDVLSVFQQRLWLLERLHPGNPVHNVSVGLRLSGALDTDEFRRTWHEVIQPYDIFRTEIRLVGGIPRPAVLTSVSPQLSILDLEGISPKEGEVRLSRLVREEVRRPFDLSNGPLLRSSLWHFAPFEYLFLLVAHRIVCDDASLKVILQEMASRYGISRIGEERASVQEPTQYRDFISRSVVVSENQILYWMERLAGAPPALDIPVDRSRPPEQTFSGAFQHFSLEKPIVERLRNLATIHDATLFMTLLAAFNVLLARYSRQNDLVVGTAISGRSNSELENLIGPLENMIALRNDLSGKPTFSQLLTRVRDSVAEAFAHQSVPLEILLERLPLDRDLSRHPLFQIGFGLHQKPFLTCWPEGLIATAHEVESGTARFELSLDLVEFADSIEGKLSYNTDLFDATTAARMSEHFCAVVAGLAANPECDICESSLLRESERHKIMIQFNETAADYRRDRCVHDFFEEQVDRTPDAIASIYGHESLTYRALNERANQLAHHLRKQGVGPETLVGICVERSLEMLIGILGILKAGGAYVPLDPAYPKERIAAILEDAKAHFLIAEQSTVGILPRHASRLIRLDSDRPDIAIQAITNPIRNVTSSHLAYVLFTSGSTGRPKGVAIEHRSTGILIQWAREVFLPEEVAKTLFATSISFDLSVFEMFVPLSMGGTVIIAQNALALPKLPFAQEVTLINTVPSAIAELLRMDAVPSSVQVVNLAGEALPTNLARQIYTTTSASKVYNLYGPTEDTTYSTYSLVPRGGDVTIGRPISNTQVYILDENQQPLPIGVPGELYLAGDGLARGYLGRDDLTRERFVPNPSGQQSDARMYRTGDLARFLSDGNIQYLGRSDNQVKLRGFRIELEEIETVLAEHPSVRSAIVIVREDIPGIKCLVAYIVPSTTCISSVLLKEAVRRRLPEYMVPSAFVQVDGLPLSPNGKINRRLLPAPEWSTAGSAHVNRPSDELESTLVNIWQSVLGIPSIGIRDDFFDLGGDSLMAARVLTELEEITGKEIPVSVLFRGSTVESLARRIREGMELEDPVVTEVQDGDHNRLPFFAIVPPGEECLGYAILARHMGPAQPVYKVQGHAPILSGNRYYSKDEIQSLTNEYVAALRTVQAHGPYCLGGMCGGTHIGEQIVLSLERQGEEVGLFAIFDTWVMQHSMRRWLWKIDYYRQRLRKMQLLNITKRFAANRSVMESEVQNLRNQQPWQTDWLQVYWPEGFVPARFSSPVILFKRPKQPFFYINDREMGWGKRTERGVMIYEADFDHSEILREPHVRVFGETLTKWIAQVSFSTVKAKVSTGHQALTAS